MEQRVDKDTETIVVKGLIATSARSLPAVIEKMSSQGVPQAVIERVFIAPRVHRATDIDKSVGVM